MEPQHEWFINMYVIILHNGLFNIYLMYYGSFTIYVTTWWKDTHNTDRQNNAKTKGFLWRIFFIYCLFLLSFLLFFFIFLFFFYFFFFCIKRTKTLNNVNFYKKSDMKPCAFKIRFPHSTFNLIFLYIYFWKKTHIEPLYNFFAID